MITFGASWKQVCECAECMAKACLHPMKVLLSVWWDCNGIIEFQLLLARETITAKKYNDQLTNLNAVIREKRPILVNCKVVIFPHDNTRPYRI